ncbi:hypothetical protein HMPREF1871_00111 [Gemelliphila asaccharolytica]|uniref:Uncharacterized protein n=1 Tax=Gemelliphila asaccharolytica TaxID=502393 RepID=A0ABR5TN88_9BACL|nr:hypothetical protein HMPREF1871_00111 [Gemella asaccharolytica]
MYIFLKINGKNPTYLVRYFLTKEKKKKNRQFFSSFSLYSHKIYIY